MYIVLLLYSIVKYGFYYKKQKQKQKQKQKYVQTHIFCFFELL
jgi:hypothetical protein